jgi:NifU-like protein involved in Fe-S cluster formation
MTHLIHPQTIMKRVLEVFPGAQSALFRHYHIGGCPSCAFQPDETLEALCARNSLNVAEVIQQIETSHEQDLKSAVKSNDDYQKRIEEALRDPKNLGELEGADAIGTAGSVACGDMIRLWIKFKEQSGKKVVDKATFQSFGCETAIAVASLATEMIRGKTAEEVLALSAGELAPGLGPLPPVKIHCTQLVESALRSALQPPSDDKKVS